MHIAPATKISDLILKSDRCESKSDKLKQTSTVFGALPGAIALSSEEAQRWNKIFR